MNRIVIITAMTVLALVSYHGLSARDSEPGMEHETAPVPADDKDAFGDRDDSPAIKLPDVEPVPMATEEVLQRIASEGATYDIDLRIGPTVHYHISNNSWLRDSVLDRLRGRFGDALVGEFDPSNVQQPSLVVRFESVVDTEMTSGSSHAAIVHMYSTVRVLDRGYESVIVPGRQFERVVVWSTPLSSLSCTSTSGLSSLRRNLGAHLDQTFTWVPQLSGGNARTGESVAIRPTVDKRVDTQTLAAAVRRLGVRLDVSELVLADYSPDLTPLKDWLADQGLTKQLVQERVEQKLREHGIEVVSEAKRSCYVLNVHLPISYVDFQNTALGNGCSVSVACSVDWMPAMVKRPGQDAYLKLVGVRTGRVGMLTRWRCKALDGAIVRQLILDCANVAASQALALLGVHPAEQPARPSRDIKREFEYWFGDRATESWIQSHLKSKGHDVLQTAVDAGRVQSTDHLLRLAMIPRSIFWREKERRSRLRQLEAWRKREKDVVARQGRKAFDTALLEREQRVKEVQYLAGYAPRRPEHKTLALFYADFVTDVEGMEQIVRGVRAARHKLLEQLVREQLSSELNQRMYGTLPQYRLLPLIELLLTELRAIDHGLASGRDYHRAQHIVDRMIDFLRTGDPALLDASALDKPGG